MVDSYVTFGENRAQNGTQGAAHPDSLKVDIFRQG